MKKKPNSKSKNGKNIFFFVCIAFPVKTFYQFMITSKRNLADNSYLKTYLLFIELNE